MNRLSLNIAALFLLSSTLLCASAHSQAPGNKLIVFEGKIPGQYIYDATVDKNTTKLGIVVIHLNGSNKGQIESLRTQTSDIDSLRKAAQTDDQIQWLSLKRDNNWDIIYPGLIDLHNHTKQNNLGVWQQAKGQFANRFEWRKWSNYIKSVRGNMKPWIDYGKPVTCATFRWSEIQAMVAGTTYLQGPSHCVTNFAIHRVEDSKAYKSKKKSVLAPTDLISPNEMVFVWNTLGPRIRALQNQYKKSKNSNDDYNLAYEEALAETINQYCDFSKANLNITIDKYSVRYSDKELTGGALQVLKDKGILQKACGDKNNLPKKFYRYIYWVHKSVISKKKYLETIPSGEGSAIISHLAEGRRDDTYNTREWELVKLLGMDQAHLNFVHGIGISESGLQEMGEKHMGLIWSPFSNLLLYNQTLDVLEAARHQVLLALGSDWLPTGSKGPLEEVKLAKNYLLKKQIADQLVTIDTESGSIDEVLYKMITENPAKMINHWQGTGPGRWENGENEGGIGTLKPLAMGTLIVASELNTNPFTNLVEQVWETDINLVVVDGKIQYGNISYLKDAKLDYEELPNGEHRMEKIKDDTSVPTLDHVTLKPTPQQHYQLLISLSQYIIPAAQGGRVQGAIGSSCAFSDPAGKGFVWQDSLAEAKLEDFARDSGLNLDRFTDIQRLLGSNLMTQSRNRNNSEKGDPDYAIETFTPLFSCNDNYHRNRLVNFVHQNPTNTTDEYSINKAQRDNLIATQKQGRRPKKMAADYPNPTPMPPTPQ